MATIRDVAALAGVSTATVSRLLSGDAPVSDRSRRRVEAAIRELGYTPNAISRALRAQRSTTVALLVADIENPFLTAVIRGAESVLRAAGYSLLLFNSDEDPELEAANLSAARQARPAGLILTPIGHDPDLTGHVAAGTAIVAVDRPIPSLPVDTVLVETRTAARRAVNHMHQAGARRVALVTGPHGTYTADERYRGWLAALTDEELPLQQRLARFTSFNVEGGEAATASLLDERPAPDGLLVANSLLAIGALSAVRGSGRQIGKDMLFTAFDDAPWTGLLGASLDVIRQPAVEVGRTAAELLINRIKNPKSVPQQVILHPTLSFAGGISTQTMRGTSTSIAETMPI
jgi:LacI family transcriptional regulator